jgi:hypothetical protein
MAQSKYIIKSGTCVIINIHEFASEDGSNCHEREGSEISVQNIKEAFGHVNFQIKECPNNLTDEEIIKTIQKEIRNERDGDDAVVFWLHSHGLRKKVYYGVKEDENVPAKKVPAGEKDFILAANNELVPTDTIIKLFINENCPHLEGKPKILIFDCCRSVKLDQLGQLNQFDLFYDTQTTPKYNNVYVLYSTLIGENFNINE